MISLRLSYLLLAACCAGLLGYGYYSQYVMYLEPCPLCISQRLFYLLFGLLSLLAAVHLPQGARSRLSYPVLMALAALGGAMLAGRQVWLQLLPAEQAPACGPGIAYVLQAFPLLDALSLLLKGDGHCAEVQWTFLSLSMASWSLLCFCLLFAAALLLLKNRLASKRGKPLQ